MIKAKEIEIGKTFWAAGIEWMVYQKSFVYEYEDEEKRRIKSLKSKKNVGSCPKMTNGDKIRSMTDNELAHWIYDHTDCVFYSCPAYSNCAGYKGEIACYEIIIDWIKQECENDG